MRRIIVAVVVVSVSCLVGCSADEDACRDVTCSGHGTCVPRDGEPACACVEGYLPSGLDCVAPPSPLPLGEACETNADCASQLCFKTYWSDAFYCSQEGCQSDADCQAQATEGETMCCIERVDEPSVCIRTSNGAPCGDRTGVCGTVCAGGLESICAAGLECIRSGDDSRSARCTQACQSNADCATCEPVGPMSCGCYSHSCASNNRCVRVDCDCCDSSPECVGDQVCMPWPAEDHTMLVGTCTRLGDLATGDACDDQIDPDLLPESERCAGYYCLGGHCSEVCYFQSDCPEPMECRPTELPLGDGTATIDMCWWPQ